MFNEVFASCPRCYDCCCMQVPPIVLGFGNFYLNDLSTFDELNDDKLKQLHEYVINDNFRCETCNLVFNPLKKGKDLKKELFDISE